MKPSAGQWSMTWLEKLLFFLVLWLALYGLLGVAGGNLGLFKATPLLVVGAVVSLITLRYIARVRRPRVVSQALDKRSDLYI